MYLHCNNNNNNLHGAIVNNDSLSTSQEYSLLSVEETFTVCGESNDCILAKLAKGPGQSQGGTNLPIQYNYVQSKKNHHNSILTNKEIVNIEW